MILNSLVIDQGHNNMFKLKSQEKSKFFAELSLLTVDCLFKTK